jgi:glycosyltransferase involved in cell wall biosynthesis
MIQKPRILYLTPSMTQGGAERQLSDLMRLHNGRAHQHLALIYPVSDEPFFYHEEGISVTFFDKRPGRLGRPALALRYGRLVAAFRPDIVHAYLWHAMDVARAFHRMFPVRRPLLMVNPQALTLTKERWAAERRFSNMTDHVIANSPVMAEDYRTAVPDSDISIIGNGVDVNRFSPGDRAKTRIAPSPDMTLLLYVGRFGEEKNLDGLLRAVARLCGSRRWPENARVYFVGRSVQPEYDSLLRTIIQQNNLADVVTLRSETPEVQTYYRACDALLLPSHYESLGNVVLEAAACARPALVSEAVNRNKLVQDGETGWVASGDDASLAAALERILTTPRADRDRMGAAARDYLLPQYRAEVMAERYLSLYNHLIESKKR